MAEPTHRADEERIRADERARMDEELRAMAAHDRDGASTRTDVEHDRVDPDRLDDDRLAPVERDRLERDRLDREQADRDRVDRDRLEHDRMVVDERRYDDDHQLEEVEVVRTRSFSVGQLLTLLVGAALIALGVAALIATGIDTPLDQPVEEVLGYDHTPLLGIAEVVAGALLVIFALRPGGRWIVAIIGVALIAGGLLVLAEIDWTVEELGAERDYAWIPIGAGAIALVASLLTPRRHQRMRGVLADQHR